MFAFQNDNLNFYMGLFKRNPFGHILFFKEMVNQNICITHRRYRGFNELQIEGSEIIRNLPDTNVLLYLIIKPILLML
jgi:hypothetical protein